MSEWLLVRLPRDPGDLANWMVADADGKLVVAPQVGALTEMTQLAGGRRVCALVPSADVLLTEAELPLKSGARLAQVVPFALEEQLADDVENLHFAVGARGVDGRTPVAVVAKSLMNEWMGALGGAGLAPVAMHADAGLLPQNPGQLVALIEHDQILASAPARAPVSLPAEDIGAALDVVAQGAQAAEAAPQALLLYATPADWQRRSSEVEALRRRFSSIKVQLLPSGPLPLFAQQLPGAKPLNLLQGAYASRTELATSWRAWRVAAALLVALVALHAGGKAWELNRLKRAERELDAQIEQVYRSAMPGEQSASDARRRMERRLAELRGSAGAQSGLLPALSALAQARGASPDTRVQGMNFSKGALELRIVASDASSLDRINQQLRASGWQADLVGANAGSGGYEGRIQMRAAGS